MTVITYETIYEVLRTEKNKESLQVLSVSFFSDVKQYIADKESSLRSAQVKDDVFSRKEVSKLRVQLDNIVHLLKDLYARRERKLMELAVNVVRTKSRSVDTTGIHKSERPLFDAMVAVLESHRKGLLYDLVGSIGAESLPLEKEKNATLVSTPKIEERPSSSSALVEKKVEFIDEVDTFIDANLNEHGPFMPGNTASIPAEIAEILVASGKAKEV